ncbi:MAG: hypothetical protein J0I29_16035 [Rhizobiales bacterium]|nr:hypothetical protein [Hyphomicrobiales bacterium]
MTRFSTKAALAALAVFSVATFADYADAASCTNSFNTCASRCRTKYAHDKNCVSDHCSPKLATCKSTGCWQQGGDFGNVLTCNLDKK